MRKLKEVINMPNRVDFRRRGLIPFETYMISNKETGEIYGDFRVGALGGLKNINGTSAGNLLRVKTAESFHPERLEFRHIE
jgi:hypothetical protein